MTPLCPTSTDFCHTIYINEIKIDQRPKYISFYYKTLRRKLSVNLDDLMSANSLLDMTPKTQVTKGKLGNMDFIKFKTFYSSNICIKDVKTQASELRKYSQIIYLVRDLYLEYINSPYNSAIRNQIAQILNGQMCVFVLRMKPSSLYH